MEFDKVIPQKLIFALNTDDMQSRGCPVGIVLGVCLVHQGKTQLWDFRLLAACTLVMRSCDRPERLRFTCRLPHYY